MKLEYILLISAGGVFLFILFLYVLVAHESRKNAKSLANRIVKLYAEPDIRKMEYDVAFYDSEAYSFMIDNGLDRQVTIDDLLSSSGADEKQIVENAIFTHVEDEGPEEIVGKYNPDNVR